MGMVKREHREAASRILDQLKCWHPAVVSYHGEQHATGWRSREPLFRNHFVTGEGCDNWDTIQGLCRRGLMRISRAASELSGGDPVFAVTEAGIAQLRLESKPKKRPK